MLRPLARVVALPPRGYSLFARVGVRTLRVGAPPPPAAAGVTPESVQALVQAEWPGLGRPPTCHEISGRHTLVSVAVPQTALRPGGYISGPTTFELVDCGMWYGVFGAAGLEPMALTSELSLRFVRPAIGETLWARVHVESLTKRQVTMSASVWTGDDPERVTAVAQGTYVLPRR